MKLTDLRKIIREEIEKQNGSIDTTKIDKVTNEIKPELISFLKDFQSDIKQLKDEEDSTNEGLMTTAGVALALPAVLGLISKAGRFLNKTYGKVIGKVPDEKSEFNKYMKEMERIADSLHHLYLVPIEKLVGLFIKDKSKAHKVATIILHVIVAVFMVSAGMTSLKAFQSKNFSLSTLEAALSAVKGGEIKEFISNVLSNTKH